MQNQFKNHSIILLHGVFAVDFFDQLIDDCSTKEVFVMEGRPSLEAAQVNCRELLKHKITPTLISDNMAGFLFFKNLVKEVWMAYQASDTDGAVCDIGALILGVLGKRHSVPVYLSASNKRTSGSTILNLSVRSPLVLSGIEIANQQFQCSRSTRFLGKEKDLLSFKNKTVAPKGIRAYVPLVEWLPTEYITKIMSI